MTPTLRRLLCVLLALQLTVSTTRGGDPVRSKAYWQARVAAAIASRTSQPVPVQVQVPQAKRWFRLYGAKWCKFCPQAESNVKLALQTMPVSYTYIDCTQTPPPAYVKSLPCIEWQSDHPSGKNYTYGVLSPEVIVRTWQSTQEKLK